MALELFQPASISSIEDDLDRIAQEDRQELVIPLKLDIGYFGTRAAICQLINTWVRKTDRTQPVYLLAGDEDLSDAFLKEQSEKAHVLLAILMTNKQGRKVVFKGKTEEDITNEILLETSAHLRATLPVTEGNNKRFSELVKHVNVLCFDHSVQPKFSFNNWFYLDTRFVLTENGMERFYRASIERLLSGSPDPIKRKALQPENVNAVGVILKELFENTDKHARTGFGDRSNVAMLPNSRGVFIDVHSGNLKHFFNQTAEGDPFQIYFLNPYLFVNQEETKTFIEISIIDSGPGLAQKRSGKSLEELSPTNEKKFVLECFTSYDKTTERRGLKRISQFVFRKKGFIKFRTGRISLFRNFLLHPYKEWQHDVIHEADAMYDVYHDWYSGDIHPRPLSEVSGTLITILFPLD